MSYSLSNAAAACGINVGVRWVWQSGSNIAKSHSPEWGTNK
jgi:hypothetical protein